MAAASEPLTLSVKFGPTMRKVWPMKDKEIIMSGPAGCIAGESQILDLGRRGHVSVAELYETRTAPTVLTAVGSVQADVPFIKGKARLFKVSTKGGRQFVVTEDHLAFTLSGWTFCGCLSSGEHILVSSDDLSPSTWESFLSRSGLGEQYSIQRVLDSLGYYLTDPHPSGGRSQMEIAYGQESSPLPAGALLLDHADLRLGDLACKGGYSHLCLSSGLRSTQGCSCQPVGIWYGGYRDDSSSQRACGGSCQSPLQSGLGTFRSLALHESCAGFYSRLQSSPSDGVCQPSLLYGVPAVSSTRSSLLSPELGFSFDTGRLSFPSVLMLRALFPSYSPKLHYPVQWDQVASVEYVRTDYYYDLMVPVAHHYLADGVWSHNTGKTYAWLQRQHRILAKYPEARGLMVRKTRASMTHTCIHVYEKEVLGPDLGTLVKWNERDQVYRYQNNGAEFVVSGLDDPTKIFSSQYDFFYCNEAIEIKMGQWEDIKTRLRNFKVPYQQALGDTNPGAPTHWIMQRAKSGLLKLVETTHKDNPAYWDEDKKVWTPQGKDYVEGTLGAGLTGIRRQRLYEGKWVAAQGQVYTQWDPEIHRVKRFKVPRDWPRYWVFDFGFVDPFVWGYWAMDPKNRDLYLISEIYHTGLRVQEAAKWIREVTKGHPKPVALICDHDSENRATLEKELGMLTLPAYKAIVDGVQAVQLRLESAKIRHELKTVGKDDSKDSRYNNPGLYLMEGALLREDAELRARYKPTCTEEEWDGYCLAAGTLVDTDKGPVSIKDVRVGDLVWTRKGLRPVVISGCTRRLAQTFTVHFSDGSSLMGTGNHPVWVEGKGWVSLASLSKYDRMLVWNPKLSFLTGSSTEDTQTRSIGPTGGISGPMCPTANSDTPVCTSISGKTNSGIFQRAFSSIIRMITRSITRSGTLSSFPKQNTLRLTEGTQLGSPQSGWRSWLGVGNYLGPLSKRRSLDNSNENRLPSSGKRESLNQESVCGAGRNSSVGIRGRQTTVPLVVTTVTTNQKREDVYNLTVEGCPEYFANGVLVHNCWDTGQMALDKYKDLPVDKDNHGMDMVRYATAFVDNLAVDPSEEEEVVDLGDEAFEEISTY